MKDLQRPTCPRIQTRQEDPLFLGRAREICLCGQVFDIPASCIPISNTGNSLMTNVEPGAQLPTGHIAE